MNNISLNDYRRELKKKILEQAHERFLERGVKVVKMDDIAHELSISKRTLYEIYPTKEELVLETVKFVVSGTRAKMIEKFSEKDNVIDFIIYYYRRQIDSLSKMTPVLYEDIKSYPRVKEYMHALREQHINGQRHFFNIGKEQGYFIDDVNDRLLEDINNIVNENVIQQRYYMKYSMDEVFHHMVLLFIRSMCTQKGIKELDRALGIKSSL